MQAEATLVLSWQAVSAILGLLLVIVGGSTAYLKLFTQNQLASLEKNILRQMKEEFQNKEIADRELRDLRERVARVEGVVFPPKS